MRFFREKNEVSSEDYFFASFEVKSAKTLHDVAWNIAIGQSVGNPNVRNQWETEEIFEKHSCIIIGSEQELKKHSIGFI